MRSALNARESEVFVPAFPTIRPELLLRPGQDAVKARHPFSAKTAEYSYFARNAIWRAVRIFGLDRGEVLAPAYHHGVEIEALMDAGARVRFYRVGPRFEVDLEDVARKIRPETTALYLTHFLGFPGPVREMKQLAEAHGLPLVEDCALALFSADRGLPLGVTGDVAIFCLYKVLAVPDGGVLVHRMAGHSPGAAWRSGDQLRRPPLASTVAVATSSMLRNLALRGGRAGRALRGRVLRLGKRALLASNIEPVLAGTQHFNRDHADLGISRLTEHLLRVQDVPGIVSRRRRNYLFLLERLRELSAPLFETLPEGVVPLCYPMQVEDNRQVMTELVKRGIEAVDFWREGHPACDVASFPEVARLRTTVLEIPCHQDLTLGTMAKIVSAIRGVLAAQPGRAGLSAVRGGVRSTTLLGAS
jgi:dTDP-4-amino-4,6-dideoxygalactose transaminase